MDNMPVTIKGPGEDLFESKMQTLVNAVNCFGVMGKGIALSFKLRYPVMFRDYKMKCRKGHVRLGEPYLWTGAHYTVVSEKVTYESPLVKVSQRELEAKKGDWILNFPTKHHYRDMADLQYIEKGLDYFAAHYAEWGITSAAFPALGCQNGGLSWRDVGPLMIRKLSALPIEIEIYEPR